MLQQSVGMLTAWLCLLQPNSGAAHLRIAPQRLEAHLREGQGMRLKIPGLQRLQRLLDQAAAWQHDAAVHFQEGKCFCCRHCLQLSSYIVLLHTGLLDALLAVAYTLAAAPVLSNVAGGTLAWH